MNYTASQHHCVERKKCAACGEEKAIKEFPVHPSSFDGHRHSCAECVGKERTQQKEQRRTYQIRAAQQRIEQQAKREQENARFRAYGYRWQRGLVETWYGDWEEGWVLHTPAGEQISTQDALQEIANLQVGVPAAIGQKPTLSLKH
jgi:hypothetical protein